MRLTGPLDRDALHRALIRIAERHEVLRTVFPAPGGEPRLSVNAAADVPLVLRDVGALPAGEREGAALRVLRAWAEEPFDLACGPLFRAGIVRLADDEHLLGIFLHHIVCDGPSMHLLFDELAVLYAGGEPPALPAQFTDFAAEQAAAEPGQGLAWWRDHLEGVPAVLALPTDRPRPARRSWTGATHETRMPARLVRAVRDLARRERATPFMVLATAYAALLGKLTGMDELVLGTPVTTRSREEHEPLIGFFVNTVPLRISLKGHPSFGELLRRVRAVTLAAIGQSGTPFEALIDGLRIDRDPATTPLVQTVLTFEPRPLAEPRLAGLRARLVPVLPDAAKFDLDVMIVRMPGSDDFSLSVTYATALFEADTVARLARRFLALLEAGLADRDAPLHRLGVLTQDERRDADERWNTVPDGDAAAAADPVLVHEWVAWHARDRPEAPAVRGEGRTVSYAELDARARALAGRLTQAGLRPGDTAAILLPRGLDLVTAVLGVLKSGAAYVPLDPAHPPLRLQRVAESAGSRLVVTDERTAHRLAGARSITPLLVGGEDRDAPAVSGSPVSGSTAPRRRLTPDDLAYVIFTSGSTGEPKAVGVPHRALANHASAVRARFGLRPAARVLQFAAITFDVAAEELYPTWAAGGCVVLGPEPAPGPAELSALVAAEAVTVVNLPASYWQRWVRAIEAGAAEVPASLELLVVGSESVDPGALASWSALTGVRAVNAYGLTETTITALTHDAGPAFEGDRVPVGLPLAGVRAYVLGADLAPAPPGVTGELYIGGTGLARGYLGRPDLTAERFLPDPYAGRPGARMHRTGDLARRARDGSIELIGRADEQVKIRGYRIEPGEVEAAMSAHPGVAQAVVAAKPGPGGASRLVGYVVMAGGGVPPDLRGHLAARLPGYLVPSAFVALAELPRTAGGKVDRGALPEPPEPAARPDGVPPSTRTEQRLALVWCSVLGRGQVGVHDNFFDLGGDSFGLAAVHKLIGDGFGRRLPLVALYEHPTVAALAAHLDGGEAGPARPAEADTAARIGAGRARLDHRRHVRAAPSPRPVPDGEPEHKNPS